MNRALVLAALLACAAASCKKPPPAPESDDTPAQVAPPQHKPIDHLAPDELLEGSDTAFDIKLPRALRVTRRYDDEVIAEGTAPFAHVVAYFKAHTREAKVTSATRSASIQHAKVPSKPGAIVDIRVDNPFGDDVRVVLHDATPAAAPASTDQAAIRKSVGLTPDGKGLIDPSHID